MLAGRDRNWFIVITDFDLRRLRGGEPVDLWHLPQHLRQQLVAKVP